MMLWQKVLLARRQAWYTYSGLRQGHLLVWRIANSECGVSMCTGCSVSSPQSTARLSLCRCRSLCVSPSLLLSLLLSLALWWERTGDPPLGVRMPWQQLMVTTQSSAHNQKWLGLPNTRCVCG